MTDETTPSETPQEPEVLTEEQRYENMKAILGDEADKYFIEAPARARESTLRPASSADGVTKFLILTVAIFVVVVIGSMFAMAATQHTEITVPPSKEVLIDPVNPQR